jgi:hypothetical protein
MLVTLMQHIAVKAGSMLKADVIINSTGIDQKARETVFEAFNSVSGGDPDKLFLYLNHWGLSAANAKEISGYIRAKYSSQEEAANGAENALFQGTKKFTDGSWNYVVTVKQDSITLKLYPSATNSYHKDKKKAQAVITGKIENGEIKTSSDRTYKYENSSLYELNNEGGWNEYKEIK